jgi:hypothetical protein
MQIYTPYAGDIGTLLQVYQKLTKANLTNFTLSYNEVVSFFLPASMFNKTPKYGEVDDFDESFISSSLEYI